MGQPGPVRLRLVHSKSARPASTVMTGPSFFPVLAEVSDLMNMEEMLATRDAHEELTTKVAEYLKGEGFCTFTLSTESCDICKECAYLKGEPCRHPERMHPCLESHGVVVSEIVEQKQMEYNLGGNTILWFSMVLFR